MKTGIVKWYDQKKRYGFITPDIAGADIFVHSSSLSKVGIDSLDEGQKVQFETGENNGRPCAVNLRLI